MPAWRQGSQACALLDTLAPLRIPLGVRIAVAAAGEDEAAATAPHVCEQALGLLHICVYLHMQHERCASDQHPIIGTQKPHIWTRVHEMPTSNGVSHVGKVSVDFAQLLALQMQLL